MRNSFPLFASHLDFAHDHWAQIVQKGDAVIDATCGNGHDTLKLCQLALSDDKGKVYAIDIQSQAIESTKQLLAAHLSIDIQKRIVLHQICHSHFPNEIHGEKIKLIVYNLGYLPKGDKAKTTMRETTLKSLQEAQEVVQPGGMISITCYPGHAEGLEEQKILLEHLTQLDPQQWSCSHHTWINRKHAPNLLLIQKANESF
jgi:SAM-dependent methyltransferase